MLPKLFFVVLFLLASPDDAVSVISLGKYNIQSGSTTTSGISSGAIMATQLHVILSSRVVGAGIFAGGEPFIQTNSINSIIYSKNMRSSLRLCSGQCG